MKRLLRNLDYISTHYLLNNHKISQFFAIFLTMGMITLAFKVQKVLIRIVKFIVKTMIHDHIFRDLKRNIGLFLMSIIYKSKALIRYLFRSLAR